MFDIRHVFGFISTCLSKCLWLAKDKLISVVLAYGDVVCGLFVASLVNDYQETGRSCVSGGCLPRIVIAALMFDAAVCTLLSYLSFLLHFLKKIIFLLVLDNSVMHVITTTGLGHCFRSFGGSNGFAGLALVYIIVVRAVST